MIKIGSTSNIISKKLSSGGKTNSYDVDQLSKEVLNFMKIVKSDGSPIAPGNFSKKFSYFLSKNGLKHIRLHDLRHSNATLMLKYGVPAKIASQRLGHSSIGITLDLYSHVAGDMQKEVVDKIEHGIL